MYSIAAIILSLAWTASGSMKMDVCSRYSSQWSQMVRTGQPANAQFPLGTAINKDGNTVMTTQGGSTPLVSHNPDFTSLYNVGNGEIVMLTQFEAPQPSSVYMVGLKQDDTTGQLTVTSTTPVDFSKYGGVWDLCAGQKTPWNSHLGGEEYEPEAKFITSEATSVMTVGNTTTSLQALDSGSYSGIVEYARYFGLYVTNTTTIQELRNVFNPYLYGYAIEVIPQPGGKYTATKWFTTGRNAKELAYVMPDNKTIYISDDGERTALFKVVLDKAGDMSSSSIYISKFTQKSDVNGGDFGITWIKLGSATQAQLQSIIDGKPAFGSIFEYTNPSSGACPSGFTSINSGSIGQQCLKLKPGMETAAAFLEPRRYGAMLGGTSEFSKMEGFTFSPKRNQAYVAITDVRRGMENNKDKGADSTKYDIGGPNDIRLPYNPCGCVYSFTVDATYNLVGMTGILCGNPVTGDPKNTCDLNGIANPDNLALLDAQNLLLIGEDTTEGHQNDVMWTYNLDTKQMVRVLSSPYGAEVTGVDYFPKIGSGKWDYLTAIIQHPYGESDQDLANKTANPDFQGIEAYYGVYPLRSASLVNTDVEFQAIPFVTSNKDKASVVSSLTYRSCPRQAPAPSGRKLKMN